MTIGHHKIANGHEEDSPFPLTASSVELRLKLRKHHAGLEGNGSLHQPEIH